MHEKPDDHILSPIASNDKRANTRLSSSIDSKVATMIWYANIMMKSQCIILNHLSRKHTTMIPAGHTIYHDHVHEVKEKD